MTSKYCTKCNILKPLSEFHIRLEKHVSYCIKCANKGCLEHSRTEEGMLRTIYRSQVSSSKKRKHEPPNYSFDDLVIWIKSHSNFNDLFNKWVESGYDMYEKPSCDRLDDYKPYTLDNIRLVTWKINKLKGHFDMKNGINNKQATGVVQLDKDGFFVNEYNSQNQASRNTGIRQGRISLCCNGNIEDAGGYVWQFT